MYGWTGNILDVDLSKERISRIDTRIYSQKYLGGRGIASRIYWERVLPETGAFDTMNHLILMTGPLVATGAQGATRMTLVTKSPMTYPERYCYGNLGGFFPAALKKAGWDGIIISGQASNEQYLLIENDNAELLDGTFLQNESALETAELIKKEHGEKAYFLLIKTIIQGCGQQYKSCFNPVALLFKAFPPYSFYRRISQAADFE